MVTVRHTYLSMGGCWDLVLGWGNKDSCSSESIVSCIWLRFSTVKIPHRKHISSLKIHQKLYKCTCIHLLSIKDLKLILTAQFSDTPTPFYFICVSQVNFYNLHLKVQTVSLALFFFRTYIKYTAIIHFLSKK